MKVYFILGEIIMDFLPVLVGVVGGTILFLALHKIFDINRFGFRAMIGMWTVCFIASIVILTLIVNVIGGALKFSGLL